MSRALALLTSCLLACATTPPVPQSTVPVLRDPLPATSADQGIVVVDVTDGPTQVAPKAERERQCTTPCALRLPLGSAPLTLTFRNEQGRTVHDSTHAVVLSEPQVLRRTLDRMIVDKPVRHRFAAVSYFVGYAALLSASIAYPIGQKHRPARNAARGLAAGGGAMLLISFPLNVGTTRRIAGSEVQFPLARAPDDE